MADVFVSYRWGDGHAALALAKALNLARSTYIDVKRIGPGRELEKDIMPAVQGARVVVAIIGKTWVNWWNLWKLHRAKDWVGRELIEALGRPGIVVIPVVVDAGIELAPLRKRLPLALRPLLDRAQRTLHHASWDEDVQHLIDEIVSLCEGRPREEPLALIPADIPFLCDRIPQDDGFAELITGAAHSKALFCVVHGHVLEAHMGYVRRLKARGTLERLFEATQVGVDVCPLEWNREYAQHGLYDKLLRSAIKRKPIKDERASDETLKRFLESPGRPTVLVLQVAWSDLEHLGPMFLVSLQAAWNRLMEELAVVPSQVWVLCVLLAYHDATQEVEASAPNLLVKLKPVRLGDVLTWMELAEVQPYVASHKSELLRMAGAMGESEWHMQDFVDAVHQLIPVTHEGASTERSREEEA